MKLLKRLFGRSLRRRYGRAGRGGEVDQHALTDLELYAENTGALYGQKQSILANIRRRLKKGTYDHSLAPKLWMYWVDAAAKHYVREFSGPGARIDSMFNKATREALAKELADRYRSGEEG